MKLAICLPLLSLLWGILPAQFAISGERIYGHGAGAFSTQGIVAWAPITRMQINPRQSRSWEIGMTRPTFATFVMFSVAGRSHRSCQIASARVRAWSRSPVEPTRLIEVKQSGAEPGNPHGLPIRSTDFTFAVNGGLGASVDKIIAEVAPNFYHCEMVVLVSDDVVPVPKTPRRNLNFGIPQRPFNGGYWVEPGSADPLGPGKEPELMPIPERPFPGDDSDHSPGGRRRDGGSNPIRDGGSEDFPTLQNGGKEDFPYLPPVPSFEADPSREPAPFRSDDDRDGDLEGPELIFPAGFSKDKTRSNTAFRRIRYIQPKVYSGQSVMAPE